MNEQMTTGDAATLARALQDATSATASFGIETTRTLAAVTEQYRRAAGGGRDFGTALGSAFDSVALKGRSLSDTLRKLALDLSALVLKGAVNSLAGSLGSSLSSALGSLVASADGNVFAGGHVKPFAKGGVVSSPLLFPLRNGAGLAGEAGAEAILPLQRGSDGRLGVAAAGAQQPVQIHFNVTASDVESFRRSETQIAAMLNRVAARGARNL